MILPKENKRNGRHNLSFLSIPVEKLVRYDNVRRQGFYQKYFVAEILKEEGNALYNKKKISEAVEAYSQSLCIFLTSKNRTIQPTPDGLSLTPKVPNINPIEFVMETEEGRSEKEKTLFRKIKLCLFLNISQCLLILQMYEHALTAVGNALELDPTNGKALFRHAKALVSLPHIGTFIPILTCFVYTSRTHMMSRIR